MLLQCTHLSTLRSHHFTDGAAAGSFQHAPGAKSALMYMLINVTYGSATIHVFLDYLLLRQAASLSARAEQVIVFVLPR